MSKEYDDFRDQIIDSAREVFAKFGYRKTTVEDIASSVYKAKSSIYHYFNGKEDIFREVIEKEASQIIKEIRIAIDNEPSPVSKLELFIKNITYKVKETSNYYSFMKEDWYDIFDFANTIRIKYEGEFNDVIVKILKSGNETGIFAIDDCSGKAKAIQLALSGFVSPWLGTDQNLVANSIGHFSDLVLHGLMNKKQVTG